MNEQIRQCKNCHIPLYGMREDAVFCNDRCGAAFARNEGYHRERFHAERPEMKEKPCEECGTPFFYNEYAQRGGQRVAQYCSATCRQRAFRKRKKESSFDGGANRWQDGRADKTQRKGTSHAGTEREKQDYQDKRRADDQRSKARADETHKGTSREKTQNKGTSHADARAWWKQKDAYAVLGVTYLSSKAQIKKAWMALIRKYHPDVCKDENATEISQAVNAAYDKLKGK